MRTSKPQWILLLSLSLTSPPEHHTPFGIAIVSSTSFPHLPRNPQHPHLFTTILADPVASLTPQCPHSLLSLFLTPNSHYFCHVSKPDLPTTTDQLNPPALLSGVQRWIVLHARYSTGWRKTPFFYMMPTRSMTRCVKSDPPQVRDLNAVVCCLMWLGYP